MVTRSYPISESITGNFIDWSMAVHNNKAYFFTGHPCLDFFDLITVKLGSFTTTSKQTNGLAGSHPWPYLINKLGRYVMQMMDRKLYVFSGSHSKAALVSNLFVVLDIDNHQWGRLSGLMELKADIKCPGPR